jgi:aryl-alcohol dehydrogenase-like predicted oxidoreductase
MKGVRGTDARTDVFEIFSRAAEAVGATTYAVAQAWMRSLSPNIVPLPGVTRVESVVASLAAVNLHLTDEQLAILANLPESEPLDAELVSDQPLYSLTNDLGQPTRITVQPTKRRMTDHE